MIINMRKEYKTRSGLPVRIVCTDINNVFSVVGVIQLKLEGDDAEEHYKLWTREGYFFQDGEYSMHDLVEVSPYDRFKIDDAIWVRRDKSESWVARHFAGVDAYGNPMAWHEGHTSHTNTGLQPVSWKYAKLESEFTPQ